MHTVIHTHTHIHQHTEREGHQGAIGDEQSDVFGRRRKVVNKSDSVSCKNMQK